MPGTKRSPGRRGAPPPGEGERSGEGVGAAGRVPVGLSEMSTFAPQAGHEASEAGTAAPQVRHASMVQARADGREEGASPAR